MLTYDGLLPHLDRHIDMLLDKQVLDATRPDYGGFMAADGTAGPNGTSRAASLGYGYLLEGSRHYRSGELVKRILLAGDFGRRTRRETGRFDLLITNFDSAPDTAFSIKLIAPIVRAARKAAEEGDSGAEEIAESLGEIVHTAAPGMASGGFHTPNHRWVLVAALALSKNLFEDLDIGEVIEAYLAESIDISEEGEYTERSTGIYNSVCNRSLRIAAAELNRPELLEPVRKNLDLSYHLTHADGSLVTSISRRQDRGTRAYLDRMIDSYYALARIDQNGRYATIADEIYQTSPGELPWLLHPFLEHPEWREDDLQRKPPERSYSKVYPIAGMWRVRREEASATVVSGLSTPFSLRYGDVELSSIKLCASYFGTSQFVGEDFQSEGEGISLIHPGRGWHYDSPGYFQPIDEKVKSEDWQEVRWRREFTPVPPLVISLSVQEVVQGFDLRVETSEWMQGIPFQIEFNFEPGGQFDAEGVVMRGLAGQTAFLKSGTGFYHNEISGISVGPGEHSHRMWRMHNSEVDDGAFRVLITLMTPVDRVVEVRYGKWDPVHCQLSIDN